EAILAVRYDPNVFTVSAADIHIGSLPAASASDAGSRWQVAAAVNADTGAIGIDLYGTSPILSRAGGSLVTITLHVRDTAPSGATGLNLVPEVNVGGRIYQTMAADTQTTLLLHPAVTDAGSDTG